MKNKPKNKKNKMGLVFCVYPSQYKIFDIRANKPICFKSIKNGVEEGSMVYQELDQIHFKNNNLLYFPPNNVAILLSISKRFLNEAKKIFENKIDSNKINHSLDNVEGNRKEHLIEKSKILYDFIEDIQISIVFSYTALEAFCNLSIPDNYEYKIKNNRKGTIEVYDKRAIERWIPLREKLSQILPEIYQTKRIKKQKFWNYYIKLEKYRNDIIHQKTIKRTEFYKNYFRKDIFDVCQSAENIIKFFYEQHAKKNRTNPLWPWLINKEREFPLMEFKSENFEVIGNLYDGIKK